MNIARLLEASADRYPDHTALVFENRRWTYSEWLGRVRRFAQALADLGVRPGDRVAFYVSTSENSVTTYFACQVLGAVAVPLNYRLSSGEAAYIIKDSDVAHIPEGHHHFDTLAEETADRNEPRPAPAGSDISALVYTSGTTGRPKGVIHTHANDTAIAMNCVMEYSLSHKDNALHLMVGGTNVVIGRYEAEKTLETIQSEGITTLFAVPTQIQEMLFHPRFRDYDVSSLRMMTTGGAAISSATMERVIAEFCPNIYNGYGMTEASLISECRVIVNDPPRVAAPSETVELGEIGQLIVRGPQAMQGYWNNPFETQKKLKAGWIYTGDLFSKDADGFYYFHGRADDMIVSGGENIYPREVEEILYHCPGVQEAAVVGLPDEKWGQVVAAFVVRADPQVTDEALDAFFKASEDIAPYKRPKIYRFVDSLPMNPSGKVLKRELTAAYAQANAA